MWIINVSGVRCNRRLGDNLVVIIMSTDPHPVDSAFDIDTKGSVVLPNTHRPKLTDLLEVEGRVARTGFQ